MILNLRKKTQALQLIQVAKEKREMAKNLSIVTRAFLDEYTIPLDYQPIFVTAINGHTIEDDHDVSYLVTTPYENAPERFGIIDMNMWSVDIEFANTDAFIVDAKVKNMYPTNVDISLSHV